MKYDKVCIESIGYTIPDETVTSDEIEERLAPLYKRLRLPAGRLELMTGISERRFWQRGVLPGDVSIESCDRAIQAADFSREKVGALIHGSVCRDHLEPATACRVHHAVGLSPRCAVYDVSNACLGLLSGMLQAANMIQLGQIQSALVVGTESGRNLVETTIKTLNADTTLTRSSIKNAVASLTIGSGSCAVLLTHSSISNTGNLLQAAAVRSNSRFHDLCQSDKDDAVGEGMQPLMSTDSETLMREGVQTGRDTFVDFIAESDFELADIDKSFSHQVGAAHRKLMLESMGIDPAIDYPTFQWLGNTGSVALPTAMGCGLEMNFVKPNDRIGLFGIGSGINCVMVGIQWQKTLVNSNLQSSDLREQLLSEPVVT